MKRHSHPAAATRGAPARLSCAMLASALAAFAPAHADTITFESVQNVVTIMLAPDETTYRSGDTFLQGGFSMQVLNSATAAPDDYGLLGARIDGANPANCLLLACPSGNPGQYFAGLNDASLALTRSDAQDFTISALRFAFVAPLTGLHDFSYGQLTLTGSTAAGATVSASRDFGLQDGNGNYTFADWILAPVFSSTALASLTAKACLYDADGACVTDHGLLMNQGQFALDDLQVAVVPEPSSYLMLLLGLAGVGLLARRGAA